MINYLPKCVGILECGTKQGTAFIISNSHALTAFHILEFYETQKINITFPYFNNLTITARFLARKNDVALLTLDRQISHNEEVRLVEADIEPDTDWYTFGYPASRAPTGGRFTGKVTFGNLIGDSRFNIDLDANEGKNGIAFDGLSGSPLLIANHIVGVITVEKNGKSLGAISLSAVSDIFKNIDEVILLKRIVRTEEEHILNYIKSLGNIKCGDDENLPFQATIAYWRDIESYGEKETLIRPSLQRIEQLINSFFPPKSKTFNGKILFTFADFGMGKSSFYRYSSSKMAEKYLSNENNTFPIYVNLKDLIDKWGLYEIHGIGCIGGYLHYRYGINLMDDYYKTKSYFFYIDSLDECGELTEENIQKVITSIEKLTLLKPEISNDNRIIISSRPIYLNCVRKAIRNHAYNNKENKYFLSIHGFIPVQVDSYFKILFSRIEQKLIDKLHLRNRTLIQLTLSGESPYQYLSLNSGLSQDELVRPIISYMLFKLIISNENFSHSGRVGIYLSFLNLLSKEAKYTKDEEKYGNYFLGEELKHRNILHASAALWMYNQKDNKQGYLKQKDLARTIRGSSAIIDEDDIIYYRFLSHSYFGNKEDTFYFQHQSFAEMLLAEYYIKILIIFSLCESPKVSQAHLKLMLGYPTQQTMAFFKGLLKILVLSSKDITDDDKQKKKVLNARKMLFPILASVGLYEENTLFYNKEINKWYYKGSIIDSTVKIPKILLYEWPLNPQDIKKIINLCIEMLSNQSIYLLTNAKFESSLFNNEVLVIEDSGDFTHHYIDRWIALFTLQELSTRPYGLRFSDNAVNIIIEMVTTHQRMYGYSSPPWSKNLLSGLRLNKNAVFSGFKMYNSVFAFVRWMYSRFDGVNFSNSKFYSSSLSSSFLNSTDFHGCEIYSTAFREIECIRGNFDSVLMNNVSFNNANLSMSNFENFTCKESNFSSAEISGSNFTYSHVYDCDFSETSLMNADLRYSVWIDCDFDGVDFEGANLLSMRIDEHSYSRYKEQLSRGINFNKISILYTWEVDEIIDEIFKY